MPTLCLCFSLKTADSKLHGRRATEQGKPRQHKALCSIGSYAFNVSDTTCRYPR